MSTGKLDNSSLDFKQYLHDKNNTQKRKKHFVEIEKTSACPLDIKKYVTYSAKLMIAGGSVKTFKEIRIELYVHKYI